MNYYDNIVILDSALNEENIDLAEKRIRETIEKSDGEILKLERWGLKKLSYPVSKHEKGYYILFVFRSPSPVVKALEGFYKVFDPVFKYMVIRLGKKEVKAIEEELQAQQQEVEPSEDASTVPADGEENNVQ